MGRVRRKGIFEHALNEQIQIILRMRKVSSGPFLSMHTFYRTFCHGADHMFSSITRKKTKKKKKKKEKNMTYSRMDGSKMHDFSKEISS